MIQKIFVILLSIFVVSCEEPEELSFRDYINPGELALCNYVRRDTFNEIYLDPQFRPFEITVETDSKLDYDRLSAYEVAELAYWLTAMHQLMGLPNNDDVYEILRQGHFVVTSNSQIFDQLLIGEDGDEYAAFIWVNKESACWDSPNNTNWTSVIRSRVWTREFVNVVIHEMIHTVSFATFGTSDSKHTNPKLWKELGENTLQAYVFNIHECTHFQTNCPGLPSLY